MKAVPSAGTLVMVHRMEGTATADSLPAEVLAASLRREGALLLRGDENPDVARFEVLSRRLCETFHRVGTRQQFKPDAGDSHTTQVFKQNFVLLGHSEGAYRPYPPPPRVCFFMCITPPVYSGGETTLIDGTAMLRKIPELLRRRLTELGVIYECVWEAERWRAEFEVETEVDLRALLQSIPSLRYQLIGEKLTLSMRMRAIVETLGGEQSFANGILAHLPLIEHSALLGCPVYTNPTNAVRFGNGESLTTSEVNQLIDAHEAVVQKHRWQAGDVLILDNTRFMHGRLATSAPCERVLVSRFGHLRTEFCPGASPDPWLWR